MDKKGFYYTEHTTKKIIYAMAWLTKQIIKEIVRKTEVLTSKVAYVSGRNGSNIMDILIDEKEY